MNTNATERAQAPISLDDLSSLVQRAGRAPVGFIVSQKIYDGLCEKIAPADAGWLFGGVRLVVDPKMPETEFETCFDDKAWRKRMREINAA